MILLRAVLLDLYPEPFAKDRRRGRRHGRKRPLSSICTEKRTRCKMNHFATGPVKSLAEHAWLRVMWTRSRAFMHGAAG